MWYSRSIKNNEYKYNNFPTFNEFVEGNNNLNQIIKTWEEIFEEFFEDLSNSQKLKLAYSFECISNLLVKNTLFVEMINAFNQDNCIELNLFPIIYGVFANTNEIVNIDDIIEYILYENPTKYDYDFTMNVIEKIINK